MSLEQTINKEQLPTKKNEKWKYTNLQHYWPQFDLPKQSSFPYASEKISEENDNIVFINGEFNQELSNVAVKKLNGSNKAIFSRFKKKLAKLMQDEG
ncbi:MAG: hypothetical protein WEB87_04860, partial [Bacteriovoracaceae bacterium]